MGKPETDPAREASIDALMVKLSHSDPYVESVLTKHVKELLHEAFDAGLERAAVAAGLLEEESNVLSERNSDDRGALSYYTGRSLGARKAAEHARALQLPRCPRCGTRTVRFGDGKPVHCDDCVRKARVLATLSALKVPHG